MNTKQVLVVLMISSQILAFEALTVSDTDIRCFNAQQCKELCEAKGCKDLQCMPSIGGLKKCRCRLCSK
uniref:AKTx n=1 Tax=Hadrurus spadix TaxID=141984 RepID=A0A1W7RB54_9SCOR